MITDCLSSPVVIVGCGNTLYADDGFGPAVIEYLLQYYSLPSGATALDAGTALGQLLFDLALSPKKPQLLIIVDAVYLEHKTPGQVFELELEHIPPNKQANFGLHQFPSVNLLQELKTKASVQIRIAAVQIRHLPTRLQPGLSPEVQQAVPQACNLLLSWCSQTVPAAK